MRLDASPLNETLPVHLSGDVDHAHSSCGAGEAIGWTTGARAGRRDRLANRRVQSDIVERLGLRPRSAQMLPTRGLSSYVLILLSGEITERPTRASTRSRSGPEAGTAEISRLACFRTHGAASATGDTLPSSPSSSRHSSRQSLPKSARELRSPSSFKMSAMSLPRRRPSENPTFML